MEYTIKLNPLVSFITTCHKTDTGDLTDLITTVLQQSYKNWELILKDDSDDEDVTWNNLNIVKDFYRDDRIKIYRILPVSGGNIGLTKHQAFSLAEGDILVELDHDDIIFDNCASSLVEAYQKFPDRCFYYSDYIPVNDNIPRFSEILKQWNLLFEQKLNHPITKEKCVYNVFRTPILTHDSLKNMFFPAHVRAWRKDFYHIIGGHDKTYPIVDDNDIILKSCIHTNVVQIARPLYMWKFHDKNTSNFWSMDETMTYANKTFNKHSNELKKEFDKNPNKVAIMY